MFDRRNPNALAIKSFIRKEGLPTELRKKVIYFIIVVFVVVVVVVINYYHTLLMLFCDVLCNDRFGH